MWHEIRDFSPGIRHNPSPGHPLGSATQLNTFACHSDENRDLIPAPACVKRWMPDFSWSDILGISGPGDLVSEEVRIGGIKCVDPVYTSGDAVTGPNQNNTNVWVGFEMWTSTKKRFTIARLLRNWRVPEWDQILSVSETQKFDPLSRPKRCYFVTGRSNSEDSNQLGPICVAWVYGGEARFFPNDVDPELNNTRVLPGYNESLVSPDTAVGHQGRVVIFPLSVTAQGSHDSKGIVSTTNENLYWTSVNNWTEQDPLQTNGFFNVIFGYEDPTGYGVIASNTADELLLIKARGGAVIARGDLNDFTAINYPNVRGTGHSLDLGTHSPLGYMYPVDASQVWLWEEGSTARNIAPFLNSDFFRVPNADLDGNPVGWGYHFTQSTHWGNWAVFGNSWFCDTNVLSPEGLPSWWRLVDPDTYRFAKYDVDWKGRNLYAAQTGFRGSDDPILCEFDVTTRTDYFSWQSHPLPMTEDPTRRNSAREVVVTAFGEGTVDVTVTSDRDPVGRTVSLQFDAANSDVRQRRYLQRRRHNISVTGSVHQIRLESRSLDGSAAPSISEAFLRVEDDNGLANTG